MFTIIGGDNKPYGPSTEDEVREWLKQGRADGRTFARKDNGEWKPLAAFPEFADLVGAGAPPPLRHGFGGGAFPMPTPDEILARDFDLDIGSCFKRSWALMQQNFWPVVGVTFLVTAALIALNQVINLISGPAVSDMFTKFQFTPAGVSMFFLTSVLGATVQAVFIGGLYRYCLKLVRGEEAELSDAFSGFSLAFGQLALLGLVTSILTLLGTALFILPGIYLSISWVFAIPLVIDRRMDFWSAMKLSLKVVGKHWFITFALMLVGSLVAFCGICVFCVGIFVSIPVFYLMLMYAYEDIFGPRAG